MAVEPRPVYYEPEPPLVIVDGREEIVRDPVIVEDREIIRERGVIRERRRF